MSTTKAGLKTVTSGNEYITPAFDIIFLGAIGLYLGITSQLRQTSACLDPAWNFIIADGYIEKTSDYNPR